MPSWPPRGASNGDRPRINPNTDPHQEDSAASGLDPSGPAVAGPLAVVLVRALSLVLAVGLLSSVAVVAICRFSPGPAQLEGVCLDAGKEAERRWEFAVSTIVTLLAGRSLRL